MCLDDRTQRSRMKLPAINGSLHVKTLTDQRMSKSTPLDRHGLVFHGLKHACGNDWLGKHQNIGHAKVEQVFGEKQDGRQASLALH